MAAVGNIVHKYKINSFIYTGGETMNKTVHKTQRRQQNIQDKKTNIKRIIKNINQLIKT